MRSAGNGTYRAGFTIEKVHQNLSSPLKSRFRDPSVIAVFFVTVCISFVSAVLRERLNHLPFAEEAVIAGHLIHGDGFLSPYDASPGAPPSCYSPPLYPLCIAAAYRVAGVSHAILVLLTLNAICFGVIAAGFFWLGRYYLSPLAGYLAAFFIVTNPVVLYFATDWWDTFPALAIFVVLLVIAARSSEWSRPRRVCAAMGGLMGLLALFNASYAFSYPLLIFYGLRKQPWRERFAGAAIGFLVFAAVIAPWTVRNFVVLDRLYFVRGGAGLQAWIGNQPGGSGWLDGDMLQAAPSANLHERALILRMGEPRYFDLCDAKVKRQYVDDPGRFWIRSGWRFLFVFLSDPTKAYLPLPIMNDVRWKQTYVDRAMLHGLTALLGLTGMWAAWRWKTGCEWIALATFLAELPFIFVAGSDRYNLPMRVCLLFFAAILLGGILHRLRFGEWPSSRNCAVQIN
jgi:4-amino-4-deoxy-L-arabinose transferase-like glycosyltransferase